MSLNKILLIGRLGKDVDLKYTQSGNAIANLSVATDESYTGQDGNRVQKTEWHKVVAYGKLAENCGRCLGKGSLVFIEGKLQTRKWQDRQGNDRYITEIMAAMVQFLDKKDREPDNGNSEPQNRPNNERRVVPDSHPLDEVPF